jgi:hypothetical protein
VNLASPIAASLRFSQLQRIDAGSAEALVFS